MDIPSNTGEPSEIAGRYQIVSRLGAGAFGTVYKAKDKVLGRMIAIKTIRFETLATAGEGRTELMNRFRREAQVSAQLRHPNIVTIYDVGEDAGISYLAMEFIDGVGLDKVIRGHGQLDSERTAAIAMQVADALDYAHRNGVVHRDIKPANVMVEPGDRVKVADFGIAKSMNSGEHLTMTGGLLGTPSYMSPEQARGEEIDGRTDLFALGCILYEMLAGVKAFRGDSVTALIFKILSEQPEPLRHLAPDVSAEMDSIVAKAIDKHAASRYQSGREFADALRQLTTAGSTPTIRQRELSTSPVETLTTAETRPAHSSRTVDAPDVTNAPSAPPPTLLESTPPRRPGGETAAPPAVRRGSGAGLIVGLGLAALLLVGVVAFGAWRFLRGSQATVSQPAVDVSSPPAPPIEASPQAVVFASAEPTPITEPSTPPTTITETLPTAAPRPPSIQPTAAPPERLTASVETAPPRRADLGPTSLTTLPATPRPTPRPTTAVEDADRRTQLDRPPAELVDGSEAGRRLAEAYRSGSSGTGSTIVRARDPIPEGLNPDERRMAINLYNLALLQEETRRREGNYVSLVQLLESIQLPRWSPPGYDVIGSVGQREFEFVARPRHSGLRPLRVDETRFVRVGG